MAKFESGSRTGASKVATGRQPIAWIAAIMMVLLAVGPFLVGGGFVQDDWSVAQTALAHPGFVNTYAHWFPIFANRPLAPLMLSIAGNAFGAQPHPYALTQLVVWLCGVALLTAAVSRLLAPRVRPIFFALAALPAGASTVLFSVGMQMHSALSLVLASLGMLLLFRDVDQSRYSVLPFVPFFLSLVNYEMFVPFGVLYAAYPFLVRKYAVGKPLERAEYVRLVVRYVLPLLIAVLATVVLQKVVMPALMPVHSLLGAVPLHTRAVSAVTWMYAATVSNAFLLAVAPWAAVTRDALMLAAIIVTAVVLTLALRTTPAEQSAATSVDAAAIPTRAVLAWVAAALLSCLLLLIVSGYSGTVAGYDNRIMTSTWVCGALLVVLLLQASTPRASVYLGATLVLLAAASVLAQSVDYARAARMQQTILASAVRAADRAHVPAGAYLLGDVPSRVPGAYDGSLVFTAPWDWAGALQLTTHNAIVGGAPLTSELLATPAYLHIAGGKVVLADGSNTFTIPVSKTWFFEYDDVTGSATLTPANTSALVELAISHVKLRKLYPQTAQPWDAGTAIRFAWAITHGMSTASARAYALGGS
jgi:hypothetical protein